jgi:hypothetical protein
MLIKWKKIVQIIQITSKAFLPLLTNNILSKETKIIKTKKFGKIKIKMIINHIKIKIINKDKIKKDNKIKII